MLFNTLTYLCFLPIVFGIYWSRGHRDWQNSVLLIASCVFYGWWDIRFLCLMIATAIANYGLITQMHRRGDVWRKIDLALVIAIDFGILCTFKYFNFFSESLANLLSLLGIAADFPTLRIILPVGISFYTFQLAGIAIDCYRQPRTLGELSPLRFLCFITFFPQLVAGPIERWSAMHPQFAEQRRFCYDEARDGMRLILWGLVKKMLVADNCAAVADQVFGGYAAASTVDLWIGAVAFTFQIYGDFSGYSDMAIGSAKLFGIRLTQNFKQPYFAQSIPDFWRRWHITLMTWFKDYLYIPLGGNRKGKVRKSLNTLAVFLCSGLWHGANWTFIAWGLFHSIWHALPHRRITFLIVVIGWVIFRSPSLSFAADYIVSMFDPTLIGGISCSVKKLLFVPILLIAELCMKGNDHPFLFTDGKVFGNQAVRMATYAIVFSIIYLFGGQQVQFIYFQF